MCECRYYGKCAGTCDGRGLCVGFGNETYDCDAFEPMPDVEALLAIADYMDAYPGVPDDIRCGNQMSPLEIHKLARRIRGAVGGGSHGGA